jgi:hypothetical protein
MIEKRRLARVEFDCAGNPPAAWVQRTNELRGSKHAQGGGGGLVINNPSSRSVELIKSRNELLAKEEGGEDEELTSPGACGGRAARIRTNLAPAPEAGGRRRGGGRVD